MQRERAFEGQKYFFRNQLAPPKNIDKEEPF